MVATGKPVLFGGVMMGREHNELARAWNDYDAYLFDIDGTLLNCTDAVHYFAFCDALTAIAGRPMNLDGVVAHGNTDVGILRDALGRAGIPDEQWRPHLHETKARMCAFVEREKHELCATALPGVTTALRHLRDRGAVLGVATGNLELIGRLKLQHCGLLEYFDFGGYSDLFEYRRDVFTSATKMARELAGKSAAICMVGDTPADIEAAKYNGLDVIAVATGIYSAEQLEAVRPSLCVTSMHGLLGQAATAEAVR